METEDWRLESMLWCTSECVRISTTPAFLCCKELDICVGMLKEARMLVEGVPGAVLVARFDIRADSIREPIKKK